MSIILYNPQDGRVVGVVQESEAKVRAWLANAPVEIGEQTAYLLYDETLDQVEAQDIFANATNGKYYVEVGELYENSQWKAG